MRGAMSYVAPWLIVTAVAVALSWLGVRDVVRGAIFDRAAPEPWSGPVIYASPSTPPGSVGTPAARDGHGDDQSASETLSPSPSPSRDRKAAHDGDQERRGEIRGFSTRGGRAVLAICEKGRRRGVRLVSATPNPGYETRVWGNQGWLRVDFIDDDRSSSVIATWHDGPPAVRIYEYRGNR
ncbi:hypothetical protein Acsp03_19320 [Actinomadura sp. NBRC 104412]|nr:hypothetical protein Acsp03_19320 [Actinomadura sp. NBRC 104412]